MAFLSSVAFQILDQDPARFPRVQELIAAMRVSNTWTQPALSVLLSSLLDAGDAVSDTQHILIDGLDKCDDKSRQSLLDIFVSIVNDGKSGHRLKVTFSVQKMAADIEEALDRCHGREGRESHSSDPYETIMRHWVSQILADTCYPSSVEPHVLRALKKCKNNTDLIFTVRSLRCLDSTDGPKTMHSMESLTWTLPPPIELLIAARFNSLQIWSRCALGWILRARRPMKTTELTTAVAVTTRNVVWDERHLPLNPAMVLESDFGPLISFGGGDTIVVSSSTIRKSLVDLVDEYNQERLKTEHSQDRQEGMDILPPIPDDLQIAETLLEYICRDDLVNPVKCALRATDAFIQPQGPLFNLIVYAVKFWPAHYRSAEDHHGIESEGINRVLKLLEDKRLARIWPTLNDKINRALLPPDVCLLDPFLLCAQLGLRTVVERLQITSETTTRQAAMNAASWGGDDHVVEILLRGAQTRNDPPWDVSKALEYASATGQDKIIDHLLGYSKSTGRTLSSLDQLICQAARLGYARQVLLFSKTGGNVNASPEGMTPLQYAAESGHLSVVKWLLDEGRSDVEGHGSRISTPLMLAAENGHKSVVDVLLKSDVYTNSEIFLGEDGILTALRLAAKAGQTATIDLLLKHVKNSSGNKKPPISDLLRDPLLVAVDGGHVDIVEQLLQNEADPAVTDNEGHTPLYWALERGNGVLAGRILQYIKSPRDVEDIGEIFHQSCAKGQYKTFYWCLTHNPELKNHRGEGGERALHLAGKAGYIEIVRRLIDLNADVDVRDDNGWTPLAKAALAGEVKIVELLLDHGAKVDETTGDNQSIIMALACEDEPPHVGEVVRILLNHGADPSVPADSDLWNSAPLLTAVSKCSLDMVKSLLEHKGINQVEPNVTGRWGWNALHYLADTDPGNDGGELTTKIAELLIVAGTNPLERDTDGWIPLHMAARSGNLALLRFLRDKHPESFATEDDDGWTAIDFGCSHPPVTQWIISQQNLGDINKLSSNGETILMRLVSAGNVESACALLEMNADPTLRDNEGMTALDRAAYHGHIQVAEALIQRKPEILSYKDGANRTALHKAIISYQSEFAYMLLDKYYARAENTKDDLSAEETEEGRTPLISAVERKYTNVITKLLELGAKTETRDKAGDTALLVAVGGGSGSIIELLANPAAPNSNRVDINAGGGLYRTALYEAANRSKQNLVNLLLGAGANVNQEGGEYNTALCAACRIGDESTAKLLLSKGADISLSGGELANALSCAVYSESVSLIIALLNTLLNTGSAVAEINAQDNHGRTAMHMAARWCDWGVIEILLNEGGDLSKVDKQHRTLLHHAVLGSSPSLVTTILSKDTFLPQIHAKDVDGWTPLHWACRMSYNYAVVEALIDHEADVCAPTPYGWTPQNIAVFHHGTSIAELVEERAKAKYTDTDTIQNEQIADGETNPNPTTRRQWRVGSGESNASCDSCYLDVSCFHLPSIAGHFVCNTQARANLSLFLADCGGSLAMREMQRL